MDQTTVTPGGTHEAENPAAVPASSMATKPEHLWPYLLLGIVLGIVFTRSGVISWFRIQEMFRFQSFHMYGIIGSAVAVAALSVWLIRRSKARSITGGAMELGSEGTPGPQHVLGGVSFGLGWGLLGACPGPLYVLIGNGVTVMLAALASAILGAWAYGVLRPRLPHS